MSYRICVVCWGNICRSPMAEYLLKEAIADARLADAVVVDSAGTSAEESGKEMHHRTRATLARHGHRDLGWGTHRARRFASDWFDEVDLVLAADHDHVRILQERARSAADLAKIRLVRSFDPVAVAAGDLGMADPWYGTEPAYEQTYGEIMAALPGILDHVRAELVRAELA